MSQPGATPSTAAIADAALVILWPDVVLFLPRIVSPEFLQ